MNALWPTAFDDAALNCAVGLKLKLSELCEALTDVCDIDYDVRKGGGEKFTPDQRDAALADLDQACLSWLNSARY